MCDVLKAILLCIKIELCVYSAWKAEKEYNGLKRHSTYRNKAVNSEKIPRLSTKHGSKAKARRRGMAESFRGGATMGRLSGTNKSRHFFQGMALAECTASIQCVYVFFRSFLFHRTLRTIHLKMEN